MNARLDHILTAAPALATTTVFGAAIPDRVKTKVIAAGQALLTKASQTWRFWLLKNDGDDGAVFYTRRAITLHPVAATANPFANDAASAHAVKMQRTIDDKEVRLLIKRRYSDTPPIAPSLPRYVAMFNKTCGGHQ